MSNDNDKRFQPKPGRIRSIEGGQHQELFDEGAEDRPHRGGAGGHQADAVPRDWRNETVSGTFTGTAQLTSGKFAIVEKSHEFTLVPWRPVIDRQLGKEVTGIGQGGWVCRGRWSARRG